VEAIPNEDFFHGLLEQLEKGPLAKGVEPVPSTKRVLLDNLRTVPVAPTPPLTGTSPAPAQRRSGAFPSAQIPDKKNPKNNNQAVKNFVRSRLTQTTKTGGTADPRASKDKRVKAKQAILQEIRSVSPGENAPDEVSSPPSEDDNIKAAKATSPLT